MSAPTNEPKNLKGLTKTTEILTDPLHNIFQNYSLETLQNTLDQICSRIAEKFDLYNPNGKIRKSTIIEVVARCTCRTCATYKLTEQKVTTDIDALYKECHTLAVSILVEELYRILNQMGYKVMVLTEAELEYGKADILITVTNYGLNLKGRSKELLIEVKTGNSISLTQIFRYLLDSRSDTVVVWRIRKRQVLVFNAQEIKLLLVQFLRMVCLRGIRLLSADEIQPCQHVKGTHYQPTGKELEEMFKDFSEAIADTLPLIVEVIFERLGISLQQHIQEGVCYEGEKGV